MINLQPYDAIITLATRFDKLHSLTLRFDLILRAPLKSGRLILDSSDVQTIGDVFYSHKWKDSNGSSFINGFQKLVLKVSCLSITDADEEEERSDLFAGTFEIRAPTDPTQTPEVAILESAPHDADKLKEIWEGLRQRFSLFA